VKINHSLFFSKICVIFIDKTGKILYNIIVKDRKRYKNKKLSLFWKGRKTYARKY